MKNQNELTRIIVEVGIFAAIGFVLDEIQGVIFGGVFLAGGSIGFAMVAVLIVAYRRGWLPAICTGLIMGTLDLITKSYLISFWQVLLDYILPYALVGLAGLFKPLFDSSENTKGKILYLSLGAFVGGTLKFLSHFLVGAIVWAELYKAWDINNNFLYSFLYNISCVGPSIILSLALLIVLYKRTPKVITAPAVNKKAKTHEHIKAFDYVINPTMIISGLFLFVFYLVNYIEHAALKDKGAEGIKLSSNQDAVLLMFTGLLLLIVFGVCIFKTMKDKQNNKSTTLCLILLSASHLVYAISKILLIYLEEYTDPKLYFVWMVLSFMGLCVFVGLYLFVKQFYEQKEGIISAN